VPGLARQVVPVLLKGLDQLAPKQTGIMSGLDALLNMYAQAGDANGYEFVPRPGTTAIANPGGTGGIVGKRLATLNGQLLMLSDTGMWRRAANNWWAIGGVNANNGDFGMYSQKSTSFKMTRIGAALGSATSCDSSYASGVLVDAISDGTEVLLTMSDSTGSLMATSGNVFNGLDFAGTQPRIAVNPNGTGIVAWYEPGSTSIKIKRFGTTGFDAAVTTVTSTASAAFNPIFDIQFIPGGGNGSVAILWNDSGTSNLTQCLVSISSLAVSATTAYAAKGANFATKGYLANSFSTGVLFVAFISTATGLHVDQFDSTTLVAGTATVYDAAATAGASITGYRSGTSTAAVYWTVKGTLPYDDAIKVSFGGAASTALASRAIASRATLSPTGAAALFLTKYRGVGQETMFLTNANFQDEARSLPDVAAADPSNALVGLLSLPNLMVGATASTYVSSALAATALQVGAAGLTSTTGAAELTFVRANAAIGAPVELNGVLHIPGALPMMYDGALVTEEGFPLAPEQSDAYVLAGGGGLTASSTYTYRYIDEWTDAVGNLYQSAPNLSPQQAVLGAGQTKVTHALPSNQNGRNRFSVVRAIYRTPSNGDGSVYYRAGSVATLLGARVAFVDTMSDATLIGQPPLYTNGSAGSTVENLAPPPCMTMTVHRSRLLAGGLSDQTAVWFSKNVTPGFGIGWSDAFVSHLGGSNETVTALGSMDSFAGAFTNTSTWTSSTDYPDDTGNGGVLQFTQASSVNGCASARLIARDDNGLICWQAKTSFTGGPGSGPWQFSRGSTWAWLGQGAQLDAAALTPTAFVAVPGLNQTRILGGTATALVFESTFKTWATWTYLQGTPTIVDAIVWNGAVVYLCADGSCLLESTSLYSDSSVSVAHTLTLSPFDFAGVAGYQRIYVGQLTGRLLGTAGLSESMVVQVTQIIDGVAMAPKVRTLTPDANGLFAGVEFDPGPNGKCSSYQVTISNTAGGANDFRCAWTLAAVTMEVGIKPNVNRLSPANRAL
jgi:hypothetical protein